VADLVVETREVEGVSLLYPKGFINAHTVRVFESELQKALKEGRFRLVVNCAALSYIASAGLGAMMGVIEEIRRNGGDLRLASLNETVLNIFEILGFDHLYRLFPSEAEAIASFRQDPAGRR
jgi:anti-sigma B factor antagonist